MQFTDQCQTYGMYRLLYTSRQGPIWWWLETKVCTEMPWNGCLYHKDSNLECYSVVLSEVEGKHLPYSWCLKWILSHLRSTWHGIIENIFVRPLAIIHATLKWLSKHCNGKRKCYGVDTGNLEVKYGSNAFQEMHKKI